MAVIAYRWEKPDRQANEMHDCFLNACAAAIKYSVNWISDQRRGRRKKAELGAALAQPRRGVGKAPYLANIDAIDFAVPIRRTALASA